MQNMLVLSRLNHIPVSISEGGDARRKTNHKYSYESGYNKLVTAVFVAKISNDDNLTRPSSVKAVCQDVWRCQDETSHIPGRDTPPYLCVPPPFSFLSPRKHARTAHHSTQHHSN